MDIDHNRIVDAGWHYVFHVILNILKVTNLVLFIYFSYPLACDVYNDTALTANATSN